MRDTNIAICPRLKTREDVRDSDERLFRNVATLQSRLEMAHTLDGKKTVSIADMIALLDMIMETEEGDDA